MVEGVFFYIYFLDIVEVITILKFSTVKKGYEGLVMRSMTQTKALWILELYDTIDSTDKPVIYNFLTIQVPNHKVDKFIKFNLGNHMLIAY